MTPEREAAIRDALTSGNENAGRLRLEAMAVELLEALDAERKARAEALDQLATIVGSVPGETIADRARRAAEAYQAQRDQDEEVCARLRAVVEAACGVLVHRPTPQAFADLEAAITSVGGDE